MLIKRLLTAAIGIPLVVYLVHAGGYFFAGAVIFLQGAALYELNSMTRKKGAGLHLFSAVFFSLSLSVSAFYGNDTARLFFILLVGVIATLLQGIVAHKQKNWLPKNLYTLLAIGYIGMIFPTFILLRQMHGLPVESYFGKIDWGEALLWLCLLGTWMSDTCAYFIGSAFGKHKLCPAISPNKSWEGAIAGFIGCVAAVYLFGSYVFPLAQVNLLVFGILVAFLAPLGDLAESQIKRFFAVKDSGALFPGHGGALDRLDSLLFVVPIIYVYLNFALG